jgi:hypothetical protein
MVNMADYANSILRGAAAGLSDDAIRRIGSQPKTPLDVAAEEAKALFPGHSFSWYRQAVRAVNREGAITAKEQRVLSVYRNALERFRLTGEC